MPTGFTLKGINLRQIGWDIGSIEGWDSWPGMKLNGLQPGYSHGSVMDDRGFFQPKILGIQLSIFPWLPASLEQTLATPEHHIADNTDTILGALYGVNGGPITLARTMPDATVREIDVRVIQASPLTKGVGAVGRRIGMVLRAPYPFWQETGVQSVTGETGSFDIVNDGNAPINNMIVTFNNIGRLTHDATGDYIQAVTTNGIVADVGARTAKIGSTFYDNRFFRNRGWWIQAEPGTDGFTCSQGANVDVSWFHHWL